MQLQRRIGLVGLTFAAFTGMVGSGWLFGPMLTAQVAGPAALIAWAIGGVAMFLLALSFAEVSGTLPLAGGVARIPHFSHGGMTSMVMGWSAWLGYCSTAPIETAVMLRYSAEALPWLYAANPTSDTDFTVFGWIFAVASLAVFVLINAFGVALFARINNTITWFKLAIPLLIVAVLLYDSFDGANLTDAPGGFMPYGWAGVMAAVSTGGVIFSFIGFRHAIDLAGEAKNPQVNLPLSLMLAILISLVLYILLQLAFMGAVPSDLLSNGWGKLHFSQNLGPLAGVAMAVGVVWLSAVVFAGAVIGPFGGALVAVGSNARLLYGMARNKTMPRFLEALSNAGVPLVAMLINFAVGAVMLFVPFDTIVALNGAAITLSFVAGPIAIYAFRRELPDRIRVFKAPFAPAVGLIGMLVVTLVVYWSGWDTTRILIAVIVVGVLLYPVLRQRVDNEPSNWRRALWLAPYLGGLTLLSWLGNFGGGEEVIPFGWDLILALLLSIMGFVLAFMSRTRRPELLAMLAHHKVEEVVVTDSTPY